MSLTIGRGENHMQDEASRLPWVTGTLPLMLAPMQGLTNRGLRGLFIERVRPDVVLPVCAGANRGQEDHLKQ